MGLNAQKLDGFLTQHSKKHLFSPSRSPFEQAYSTFFTVGFLLLPYFLFYKKYYYNDIYSRNQHPNLSSRTSEIAGIFKNAGTSLGAGEEVLFAIIPFTVFTDKGLIFTNQRVIYNLNYGKGIGDQSKEAVAGIKDLSEIGVPMLSTKSFIGDVNLKFGDDIIGSLNDVYKPKYLEDFLVELHASIE